MAKITLDQIRQVNFDVNNVTKYQMPKGHYHWENSDEMDHMGMCADQAIAKWERLFNLGMEEEDMRFAIVGVETPSDHMILCARSGGKWYALDIRYPDLMDPGELPYSWVKWGKNFNVGSWTTVEWK